MQTLARKKAQMTARMEALMGTRLPAGKVPFTT